MGGSEAEPLRLEVEPSDGTITAWINTTYHDSVRTFLEARIEDAKAKSRLAAAHHMFKNGLSQVMVFTNHNLIQNIIKRNIQITQVELVMGPGGVIAEPRLTGDFTTAILWSRHLPKDPEETAELVLALAEALPDAQVKMKKDSKDEMRWFFPCLTLKNRSPISFFLSSMFIYWKLPSMARINLPTVHNCLRGFDVDPECLLVCAKTARFDSQFTLTLRIERRKLSR